jgi:hypothetical protein
LAFQRACHRRRHRRRIAAGEAGLNLNGREVDGRQVAHRQYAIGYDAEERDGRHEQARGDRALDEPFRNIHSITILYRVIG